MASKPTQVQATAQEVLPRFGLAYLVDDQQRIWGITKSTEGPGLERLHEGQKVTLTVLHHPGFSLVRRYEPLN
ncbi:hypothetical protein BurJ1DRAFT_0962 [Burkholderiales bacterium JOSHI_001]|nr:hypothetical protein BurJ1DRAFT_0962 [Burkholderiales bacterium JOSHI_001]